MASSQHRCVFVGNIPYDVSEEQLIEICKEVGPVVSFRLVIDRETGKPKGYGFCEYKDEETALSARRNLQGYEINGRQLRVDFAENDKGVDKNREQGRGGPGLAPNIDSSKQIGGPAAYEEAVPHQPIGLHSAITAAAVVAGALGGAQAGVNSNQNGLQNQFALANDPLTLHLAKMSRSQLNEIVSELKMMGTQNKELARQLLLGRPQLAKALFQAQIMLGMVTPQVLQMPNIRQVPAHNSQPSFQDSEPNQHTSLPGLPPIAQTRMQSGFLPQVQQGHGSSSSQFAVGHNSKFPVPSQLPMQSRSLLPQHNSNVQGLQQATLPGQAHSTATMALRPQQLQMTASSSLNQQIQPSLLQQQQPVPMGASSLGQNTRMLFPNVNVHPNVLSRPQSSKSGYQSMSSGIPETITEKTHMVRSSSESTGRPPKLAKLDDVSGTRPSQLSGPANPVPRSGGQYLENQNFQPQLAPEMESALLQQVMSLTPEQLSSLPPEQKQQVIQLQQLLRKDPIQPS